MSSFPNTSSNIFNHNGLGNCQLIFPACWEDDNRMDALFSPFRPEMVNPENYSSKLQFWKDMIKKYCLAKGTSEINFVDVCNAFKRKGKYPHCIATVIEEMLLKNEIESKQTFMEQTHHSWPGWAVNSVKTKIKWGLTKVKESIFVTKNSNESYIVKEIVKKQSEEVLTKMENFFDNLLTFDEVLKKLDNTSISSDGLKLCIHLLNCQQKVFIKHVIIVEEKKMLLKFAGKELKVAPITDLELSIRELQDVEKALLKACDDIEESKKTAENETRRCLREGKKQLAKTFLRKKHIHESSFEKRSKALENVQIMLTRIEETKHNANIVQTYKLGTKTLQAALDASGVTVDNLSDALDEVKELLSLHEEVQTVMAGSGFNQSYSDEQLELELENLLNDNIPDLPECPDTSINNEELENRIKQLKMVTS